MANAVSDASDVCGDAVRLMSRKIEFIPNADFRLDAELKDEVVDYVLDSSATGSEVTAGLPSHLQRLCDSELLTYEQEQSLFHAMNYRKFQAHSMRSQLNPSAADPGCVAKIESLLEEAQVIRDHIIKANIRLVISIVKKFVAPQSTFDEMLSDGLVSLMNCVDKFDYDRGFRFSTYAYRSIAREAYRSVKATKLKSTQFAQNGDEFSIEPADDRCSSAVRDGFWSSLRERAGSMINRLDRRERFIIRSRYALGSHRKVKSLQFLANKLGVSKERARQLEIRAVGKLREMATEVEIDDLIGSALL